MAIIFFYTSSPESGILRDKILLQNNNDCSFKTFLTKTNSVCVLKEVTTTNNKYDTLQVTVNILENSH